jgi:hypothetical protein
MATVYSFTLRIFGSGEHLDEVEQYLEGRLKKKPHGLFIRGLEEYWTPLNEHAPGVLCGRANGVLTVSGESKWGPATALLDLLREQFTSLNYSIQGCDEDLWFDEWEVLGAEEREIVRAAWVWLRGQCNGFDGFVVPFYLVKDGQPVSREQRQAHIAESMAETEREWREEHGYELTPEERETNNQILESMEACFPSTESGIIDLAEEIVTRDRVLKGLPKEMSTEDRASRDELEENREL